jgi:hypothetical protein
MQRVGTNYAWLAHFNFKNKFHVRSFHREDLTNDSKKTMVTRAVASQRLSDINFDVGKTVEVANVTPFQPQRQNDQGFT